MAKLCKYRSFFQIYESLKDTLYKGFNLTEECFKLRKAKPGVGEAPTQLITRLESYVMRWIDLAARLSGSEMVSINEVALRPVELALGWVTVCG